MIGETNSESVGLKVVSDFLRNPLTYPEAPDRVEERETHISRVFLTHRYAYKLKKPVKFDFLDFSTPQLRRHAGLEEVRLNRRLAPDVYLAVIPITQHQGQLALGGEGKPIDWVVKMRRLEDSRSLRQMLSTHSDLDAEANLIAERMVDFYQGLPSCPVRSAQYVAEFDRHIRDNRRTLLESNGSKELVHRVHTAQLLYLHLHSDVFGDRVEAGRVIEGHGDLRPDHIYFLPEPVVIDCIEFNAEFRRLDTLDEMCFLAMECAHWGAETVGRRVIERYLEVGGDRPPDGLQAFYTAYRACVRAKVDVLRASQQKDGQVVSIDDAARYLELADRVTHAMSPPVVLVVRGPSGVGKTTLAIELADWIGATHLQTDAIRIAMFGESDGSKAYDQDRYSRMKRKRVYRELIEQASTQVAKGLSVVVDGTFLDHSIQREAVDMAIAHGAQPLLINCRCPKETAASRINERARAGSALSDATSATLLRQLAEQQPPPPDLPQCEVDTTESMSVMKHVIAEGLKELSHP